MIGVDLFCGAGGLTRGLLDAGIEVRVGVDIDPDLRRTYEQNNPPARFMRADVRELRKERILNATGLIDPDKLLLAGCAPCQTFSKQYRGRYRTPEGTLLGAFGKVVAALRPGWVLVENVPGITQVPGFSTYRRFIRLLEVEGYGFDEGVLNASDLGVPQHRRRFVLIASRIGCPTLPSSNWRKLSEDDTTVRGWISHFPAIAAGQKHPSVPNHVASPLSALNLRRIRATPHDGGSRLSWPDALELRCHRRGRGKSFTDVYGRMWWDREAPTLTGRCISLSNGRFGHPEQDRAISLREAASLQTFPDSYEFFGSRTQIAQWIGNAVPVRMGQVLGKHIVQDC